MRSALRFDAQDRKITAKQLRDAFAVTSSRLQRLMPWCNG
ncbi:Serine-threonine kinase Stk1 [Pseudomonas syringae pv. maculicola]|uniref:Serine-threonine kinase Stk1 n=1 Tax=Pseudomonas syringae pv. maculicola TaxID=59511 RepID=A0A3M2ZH82_PSEYM|nr:Serine-threonine kinase Stk1 [Pseudomonas syringae pv. maculicola]